MTARLRVTVLGCGASPGVPRIGHDWGACDPDEPRNRRRRCALLVDAWEDAGGGEPTRILVDAGPDLRVQLLDTDVETVDGVVFTHAHADHAHGIDDLRAFWLNTGGRRVEVYSDAFTHDRLMEAFRYCFEAPSGGAYPPILHHNPVVAGTPFAIAGAGGAVAILPFRQRHGGIDTLGLRIGGFAYSSDISDVPDESLTHLAGLDVWMLDALRYRPHPSHFSVDEALQWVARIKPRRAVLTHLHGDLDYATLVAETPDTVAVAHDGMVLEWRNGRIVADA